MAESADPAIPRQTGAASRPEPADGDLSGAMELDGVRFPHCDQRILHAPGECTYCDMFPSWQELRDNWGIAFTGHPPIDVDLALLGRRDRQLPCPADYNRLPGTPFDHQRWPGNRVVTPDEVPTSILEFAFEPPRDETGRPIEHYGNASPGVLRRLARGWRRPGRWWP